MDRELRGRPTEIEAKAEQKKKREYVAPVSKKILQSLLSDSINTQDGMLCEVLAALKAIYPYADAPHIVNGDLICKYETCDNPLVPGAEICYRCAVGMVDDILDNLPNIKEK